MIFSEATKVEASLDRALSFACAGVLATVNAEAGQIIDALRYLSPLDAMSSLAGISAVIWFAIFVALKIGLEPGSTSYRKFDLAVLVTVAGLSFLPISFAALIGLSLCGGYLLATSRYEERAFRVAMVLLALTGPLLWGRVILNVFITPLLALDAHLVGSLIGTKVDGNTVEFAHTGRKFLIGGPCSSVHNISLAVLLWTTAIAAFKLRIDRRLVAVGCAMVLFMFILNIARLASIGLFHADFDFLHSGAGALMFGWAGLVGAGFIITIGVTRAVGRQR